MDTARITQPTPQGTRELRALALAEERFEEIAQSHRGGSFAVPSLHGEHHYDVTYTAREETCSCPDWQIRGATCYHVMAAAVVRAKTGICSGCGHRFRPRDLVELHEDNHDNLTHFDGDHSAEPAQITPA